LCGSGHEGGRQRTFQMHGFHLLSPDVVVSCYATDEKSQRIQQIPEPGSSPRLNQFVRVLLTKQGWILAFSDSFVDSINDIGMMRCDVFLR
jgi:hypothetical protein